MPYTYVLVLGVECSDRSVESDSYDVKSIHIPGERKRKICSASTYRCGTLYAVNLSIRDTFVDMEGVLYS